MTYSIVARDPATGELGVAVQCRWFASGNGVPWVEPGVGAVATQSSPRAYGPHGLRLMREGRTAADALAAVLAADAGPRSARSGWSTRPAAPRPTPGRVRPVRLASRRRRRDRAGQHDGAPDRAGRDARGVPGRGGDLASRLLAALDAAEARGRRRPRPAVRGARRGARGRCRAGCGRRRPWARRVRPPGRGPSGAARRAGPPVGVARAYEAMDEAGTAGGRGDMAAAAAASERSVALAPDDDQVRCGTPSGSRSRAGPTRRAPRSPRRPPWSRGPASTSAGSPRPGHLPGGESTLRALGLDERAAHTSQGKRKRPTAPR